MPSVNEFLACLLSGYDGVSGGGLSRHIVTARVYDLHVEIYEAPSAPAVVVLSEIVSDTVAKQTLLLAFLYLVDLTVQAEVHINRVVLIVRLNSESDGSSEAIGCILWYIVLEEVRGVPVQPHLCADILVEGDRREVIS